MWTISRSRAILSYLMIMTFKINAKMERPWQHSCTYQQKRVRHEAERGLVRLSCVVVMVEMTWLSGEVYWLCHRWLIDYKWEISLAKRVWLADRWSTLKNIYKSHGWSRHGKLLSTPLSIVFPLPPFSSPYCHLKLLQDDFTQWFDHCHPLPSCSCSPATTPIVVWR